LASGREEEAEAGGEGVEGEMPNPQNGGDPKFPSTPTGVQTPVIMGYSGIIRSNPSHKAFLLPFTENAQTRVERQEPDKREVTGDMRKELSGSLPLGDGGRPEKG